MSSASHLPPQPISSLCGNWPHPIQGEQPGDKPRIQGLNKCRPVPASILYDLSAPEFKANLFKPNLPF